MPPTPDIPLFDLALGLASAVLMFAAALYLVRARTAGNPGLPPLHYSKSGQGAGELFAEFVPDHTVWRLSLVGSLFLHVLFVSTLPLIELLTPAAPLLFDINRYDVVIVQYKIRDKPLALPSDLAVPDAPAKPLDLPDTTAQPDPLGLPTAQPEQTQRAEGPGQGPVIDIKAGEQPPVSPSLAAVAPEAPAPTATTPDVQEVIAWNLEKQQSESLAMMRPARFELPGQEGAPLENPPSLADLGLTDAPPVARNAALPAPEGVYAGGEVIESPASVAGPPLISGPGGSGYGYAFAWRADNVLTMVLQMALENGPLGQLLGIAGSIWGGSGDNRTFRAGAADGPEAVGFGKGRPTPVPRKYHGIILVSNALSTLPEAMGVLTGNPVYTVYVDVPDAPRKWILQFCVPQAAAGAIEMNGEVVQVLNRKTLNPPFATHKEPFKMHMAPNLERVTQLPNRIVAYGTVDAEGNLHNVRIIRGADPETDNQILASLRNWEFSPAFRDGEPIEVEAVFGIPLF